MKQFALNNVNGCVNTNINSSLGASGSQSYKLYLNVHFFNNSVHQWQVKTVVFLHWCLIPAVFWPYGNNNSHKKFYSTIPGAVKWVQTLAGRSLQGLRLVTHCLEPVWWRHQVWKRLTLGNFAASTFPFRGAGATDVSWREETARKKIGYLQSCFNNVGPFYGEIGWLLSSDYIFGQVARQCC